MDSRLRGNDIWESENDISQIYGQIHRTHIFKERYEVSPVGGDSPQRYEISHVCGDSPFAAS